MRKGLHPTLSRWENAEAADSGEALYCRVQDAADIIDVDEVRKERAEIRKLRIVRIIEP